jgi:hypothetical protein
VVVSYVEICLFYQPEYFFGGVEQDCFKGILNNMDLARIYTKDDQQAYFDEVEFKFWWAR